MSDITFGRWLSETRKNAGLSQQELAGRMGEQFDVSFVNELEQDRADPRSDAIYRALNQSLGLSEAEVRAKAASYDAYAVTRKRERDSTRSAMLAFRLERPRV